MPSDPLRPTGIDAEALFHGSTWDRVQGPQGQMRNSSTVSVRKGPKGNFFKAAPPGSNGSKLILYKITELLVDDYFMAQPWNPTINNGDGTYGGVFGAEIAIAKCIGGRLPDVEKIDGIIISYTYDDDNHRTASAEGYSDETHVMHTRYDDGDFDIPDGILTPPGLIVASRVQNGSGVTDGDGNEIYLMELSPQRFWALASGG